MTVCRRNAVSVSESFKSDYFEHQPNIDAMSIVMTSEAIFSLVQHFLPTRVSDPDTARCEITRTKRCGGGHPSTRIKALVLWLINY